MSPATERRKQIANSMASLFFLAVFGVLAVLFLLPLVLVVMFDRSTGGPRFWLHLALNVTFSITAIYYLFFTGPNLHDLRPLLFIPAFLALGIFYAFIFPRLVPLAGTPLRRLRVIAMTVYLMAFAASMVMMFSSAGDR